MLWAKVGPIVLVVVIKEEYSRFDLELLKGEKKEIKKKIRTIYPCHACDKKYFEYIYKNLFCLLMF